MYSMRRTGFTIVELLIVIVVVAILAAVSVASYNAIQNKAYSTRAISVVDNVAKALAMYKVETGHYPATPGGVPVCIGEAVNYPAADIYGLGECDSPQGRAVSASFNANLKQYLASVPDGSMPSIVFGGEGTRGIIYVSDAGGNYMRLSYAVRSNQPCPKGRKTYAPGILTVCDYVVPEDAEIEGM